MKSTYLIIIFFSTVTVSFSQQEATTKDGRKILIYEDSTWAYADSNALYKINPVPLQKLEIPKVQPKEVIITHTGYSLSYNETHEQANWVAYELTSEETNSTNERTDKFLVDPKIQSGTANDKDYSGSGYDRGHMAPAGDMGWSSTAMAESFYYSNMTPQDPSCNRGVWKRVEELVRAWAVEYKAVYVVTGPVLTSDLSTIGINKVSVPKYYYKVILDYTAPGIKAIGFIIPNSGSQEPLQRFAVTIDSVESFTGLDFFPMLPDDQEKVIEGDLNLKVWTWKASKSNDEKEKLSASVPCKGNTKAGDRCKNKTLNPSEYCYLHESQNNSGNSTAPVTTTPLPQKSSTSVQCSGTTKKGNRCKNMTTNTSGRCYLH